MKKTTILMAAGFLFAIGSAFVSNSNLVKFNTTGKYWDGAHCVAGSTTLTCGTSGNTICKDDNSGVNLADGTASTSPCGTLFRRNTTP